MASVEIQTPDGPMRVRLDRDHLTIGRLSSNDIALPYPHISRSHAELRLQGQSWWVVDLRSTNGLHVGGQRVHESRLAPGVAVQLSPQITLALLEEAIPPSYAPSAPLSGYAPMPAAPTAHVAPQPSYAPSYPSSYPPTPPAPPMPNPAAVAARAPAPEPIPPLSALGPRSPYADDEAPFYPQMRPMRPAYRDHPTYAPAQPAWPPQAMRQPRAPTGPTAPVAPMAPMAPLSVQPSAELPSGVFDPQGQTARAFEERRNAQAGPSPLLHVCQTCGQRTQPDAVYCQNCHHSIASECPRCRLSLLPIQDLCPRCQASNPHSARRARRTANPL